MSVVHLTTHDPKHFLVDSSGDMWEVSKEIAKFFPRASATVESIDIPNKTIYFSSPLPKEVKADA